MRCPSCASLDTQVKDSRPTEDSAAIRRRRVCLTCNFRFTTFERVQLRELVVIKRNGRRVPFDRDKLMRSIQISLRKRNVDPERVEQIGLEDRARTGKPWRKRNYVGDHRRNGDGASARARRRRLCPLRVGLSQFPRAEGFRGRARSNCRKTTRLLQHPASDANDGPRGRRAFHVACACARAARARQYLAQSRGRRRRGQKTARLSGADGRNPAAVRMRKPRRSGARGRRRAAPRSMRRSSPARITARRRLAPTPSSPPALHVSYPRSKTQIRKWPGRVMRACAPPASRSRIGLKAHEAARDHAGHIRRIRDRRPHVTLKLAVSADGKVALAGRKPAAITSEAANARVHLMRAMHDAILIGIGTALSDDPLLTCRLPGMEKRSPVRVVLDRDLRLPVNSRLAATARESRSGLLPRRTHRRKTKRRCGRQASKFCAARAGDERHRSCRRAQAAGRQRDHAAYGRGRSAGCSFAR